MNAIASFRLQQLAAKKSNSNDSLKRKSDDDVANETTPSSNETESRPANPKPRYTGDLRQRSLAMYKSINNMLTLVNKKDLAMIVKISIHEAEGTALDFCYQELQNVGPVMVDEVRAIRSIVNNVLAPGTIEKCFISNKTNGEDTQTLAGDESEADTVQMIDSVELKALLKESLIPLKEAKKKKLEESPDWIDFNEHTKVEASVSSSQGVRKTMEDQISVIPHVNELLGLDPKNSMQYSFFGLYDGHAGKAAAEYARVHLHLNLLREELVESDILYATQNAYKKTGSGFCAIGQREGNTSGSTAVTCLVRGEKDFVIANAGDSEAVLCRNGVATVITVAHVPEKECEKERILKAGGTVVWYGTWRVNGLLSVSRSLGDYNLEGVVIPDPSVTICERTDEDEFVILGTDGLWDVFKPQEACDFVKEKLLTTPRKDISQLLLDEAIEKKTVDNVAILIVYFEKLGRTT